MMQYIPHNPQKKCHSSTHIANRQIPHPAPGNRNRHKERRPPDCAADRGAMLRSIAALATIGRMTCPNPALGEPFDFIIVGAGVAGCILANRLSADPATRVLLLEAGGPDTSPLIAAPGGLLPIMMSGAFAWRYMSAPQAGLDDRALYLPRGKVLGGGSSINGMVYDRGFASDYDRWAQPGWSFAEVLPYFRRLECYAPADNAWHGRDGPIQVSRAAQDHPFARAFCAAGVAAGYPASEDLNGARRDGFGAVDLTIGRGRRSSAAAAYLRPVRHRRNLVVLTGAAVHRVLFDGTRAIGVSWRGHEARARREVILAAGAIATPHVLMLSGIGPAPHLQAHGITPLRDHPQVGQGLQDHLAAHVRHRATRPLSLLRHLAPWRGALAMGQYLVARKGPLADPGMSVACFVRSDPALAEPDLKMLLVSALFAHNGRSLAPMHGFYAHINVARPRSRGTVTLAGADPDQPPVIDPGFNTHPDDRRAMRQGIRIARRIFAQGAFDDIRGEELAPGSAVATDDALDASVRAHAEADYHSVGTAGMGAVVDAQLRVHGLAGLRVVDASVMPRLPGGNTAIPVAMIAEKAADLIRGIAPPDPEYPGEPQ
jgi:choline dehydrogenase